MATRKEQKIAEVRFEREALTLVKKARYAKQGETYSIRNHGILVSWDTGSPIMIPWRFVRLVRFEEAKPQE